MPATTSSRTSSSAPAPLDRRRDCWPHGPAKVVLLGPPGTGKTRALLEGWLLPAIEDNARALAVSFTKAAAGEIAARCARARGGDARDFYLASSTIHAECLRLVRRIDPGVEVHGGRKGLRPDELEDEAAESADVDDEAAQLVKARGRRTRESELRRAAVHVWSHARSVFPRTNHETMSVEDLIGAAHDHFAGQAAVSRFSVEQLAAEVAAYEKVKEERHEVDFTDMLERAFEHGEIPSRQLLVVDEAQDLSPLQWLVVESWARYAERVVVIGDPDQAIHSWCGADASPLLRYARDPGWAARRLAKSWRVPRRVHAMARRLILQDPDRLDAPYEPADREGSIAEPTQQAIVLELDRFARELAQLPDEERAGRQAFCLARAGATLRQRLAAQLAAASVPFVNERGYYPLNAKAATAIARAVLAARAPRPAPIEDWKRLLSALPGPCFPPRKKEATRLELGAWPDGCLVRPQSIRQLGVNLDGLLVEDLGAALQFPRIGGAMSPDRALQLAGLIEAHGEEVLEREPVVVLTTLHASKGREAELVVLDLEAPKAVRRSFGVGDQERIGEERRLLYVGLTRTSDRLLLLRGQRDLGHLLDLGR